MKTLADRVKRLIDHVHGGSVNRAAGEIGLSHVTIGRIAKGEVESPRADVLVKIAKHFDASIDWLVSGRGEAPAVLSVKAPVIGPGSDTTIERKPTPEAIAYILRVIRMNVSGEVQGLLQALPTLVSYAAFAIPFGISSAQVALLDEAREDAYSSWHKFLRVIIEAEGEERACEILEASKETLRRIEPPVLTDQQFAAADRAQRARAKDPATRKRKGVNPYV